MTNEEKEAYFVPGMVGYFGNGRNRTIVRVVSVAGDKFYGKDRHGNIVSMPSFPMVQIEDIDSGYRQLAMTWYLEPMDPLTTLGSQGP